MMKKNVGNQNNPSNQLAGEYYLEDISYGNFLEVIVDPGETIKVTLTNDWCPM